MKTELQVLQCRNSLLLDYVSVKIKQSREYSPGVSYHIDGQIFSLYNSWIYDIDQIKMINVVIVIKSFAS